MMRRMMMISQRASMRRYDEVLFNKWPRTHILYTPFTVSLTFPIVVKFRDARDVWLWEPGTDVEKSLANIDHLVKWSGSNKGGFAVFSVLLLPPSDFRVHGKVIKDQALHGPRQHYCPRKRNLSSASHCCYPIFPMHKPALLPPT